MVVLNEAKEYAWRGMTGLYTMAAALSDATDKPVVPLLGSCARGEFGPAVFYDAEVIGIQRCYGYGVPFVPTDKKNWIEAYVRAADQVFGVLPIHWDYQDGDRRLAEAKLLSWVASLPYPALIAGDCNSTASGPHKPRRDFSQVSESTQYHKAMRPSGRDELVADTRAVDYLIGWWDEHTGTRRGGTGFHDLAEIAGLTYGEPDTFRPTVTTDTGADDGGGLQIDHLLINTAGHDRLIPATFAIEIPRGAPPSTHRVLRAALDLARHGAH
ncbi:MAG: hypothetical protein ACRDQ5_15805 [Sciscionella sp.]